MKLIATRIPTPFDKKAFELYEKEFNKGEPGLILFPDGSIEESKLGGVYELSGKYNIGIIGTVKEGNHQKIVAFSNNRMNFGPISYPDEFVPNLKHLNPPIEQLITENGALTKYYKEDKPLRLKVGNKEFNSLIRICSDLALPYLGKDIADLLLIPSEIEHPSGWFYQHINDLKKNLTNDAKIMYSPLATAQTFPGLKHGSAFMNTPMGIYDIHLNQLGEIKGDYSVLNIK
jgi:hypothetical protein